MTVRPLPYPRITMQNNKPKAYIVGGYVRDQWLREHGISMPESDRDWVVVGATPETMLKKGYLPVGKDFPVFLHPQTHEEYALARTERKTAPGYHGFVFHTDPSVTLEEDLARRDLTINAIAFDPETQTLIDPYHGIQDLESKTLRHVSPAFNEDPVRLLRVARLASKLKDFELAPETLALLQTMVISGETKALVAERVWTEFEKAMNAPEPWRFLEVIQACGYQEGIFSGLVFTENAFTNLRRAKQNKALPPQALIGAFLLTSLERSPTSIAEQFQHYRAPKKVVSFLELLERNHGLLTPNPSDEECFEVFISSDVLRQKERFLTLIELSETLLGAELSDWRESLNAFDAINPGEVAQRCQNPKDIPVKIKEARLQAIKNRH